MVHSKMAAAGQEACSLERGIGEADYPGIMGKHQDFENSLREVVDVEADETDDQVRASFGH